MDRSHIRGRQMKMVTVAVGIVCYVAILARPVVSASASLVPTVLCVLLLYLLLIGNALYLVVHWIDARSFNLNAAAAALLALAFLLGIWPVRTYVLQRQDKAFLARLSQYEKAIAWISENEVGGRRRTFY